MLLPAVADELAEADTAALQQLQKAKPGKLSSLVDAALQSMLSVPTMAALARRLASTRGWASLQRLAAAGCIPCLALAPGVLPAAAEAQQHALVTSLLQHCIDVRPEDLAATLCALLGDGNNVSAHKGLANGHDHDMTLSDEEQMVANGDSTPQDSMAAWPSSLHALVRTSHDQSVLLQALRMLRTEQIIRLGQYLTWVLVSCQGQGWDSMERDAQIPNLTAAIGWACALVDAQYTTIVLQV